MSSRPLLRRRAPFFVFVAAMAAGCGGLLELPTADGDEGPSGSGVGQAGEEDDGNDPATAPGRDRPRGPKTPRPSEPPGTKPGTKKPNGASPPNVEVGDPYCPPPMKFDARQYDGKLAGYKRSVTPTASCTAADLDRLELNIATTAVNQPFARLLAGLGAECQSCIVTPSSADAWGPVVDFDEDWRMGNVGACHAVVNESVECGKAVQYHAACTRVTCMDCTYSTVKACVANVRSAQCKETYDAAAAACPKFAQSKTQCGFGPAELVPHVGNLAANARAFCGAGL